MNWREKLWNLDAAYARGLAQGRALRAGAGYNTDLLIRGVQQSWPEGDVAAVRAACLEARQNRLAAVPDLSVYPELDGCREALLAEDRGMMEGAGLTPSDLGVQREYFWVCQQHAGRSGVLPDKGCTGVYIADSPVGPLAANNLDDWLDSAPVPLPAGPPVNAHGLGEISVSCGIFLDERSPEIFPAPVVYMTNELCANVHDAVELLTRYNYFWGPTNRLLFDKNGDSVVIEKSACRYGLRWGDGYSYTTAIHMETPAMKPFVRERREEYLRQSGKGEECADAAYWRAARERHQLLAQLTQSAAANPSVAALQNVMQARQGAASLCLHGDKSHPDDEVVNYTLTTKIFELAHNRATVWRIRAQDGTPACGSEPERLSFS